LLLLHKILLHILSTEHVRINCSDNYLHIDTTEVDLLSLSTDKYYLSLCRQ